jgi:hypothetical protein
MFDGVLDKELGLSRSEMVGGMRLTTRNDTKIIVPKNQGIETSYKTISSSPAG